MGEHAWSCLGLNMPRRRKKLKPLASMGAFKNISKPLRRQYGSSAFTWQVPKTAHWVLQPKRVGTGIPTLLMQQSPPFSFCPVSWLLSTVLAAELEGSSGRYALTICECSLWDWRHAWLPTRPSINRSEFQSAFDTRRWASTWQDHANRGTGEFGVATVPCTFTRIQARWSIETFDYILACIRFGCEKGLAAGWPLC